jgi:hypothetical protein
MCVKDFRSHGRFFHLCAQHSGFLSTVKLFFLLSEGDLRIGRTRCAENHARERKARSPCRWLNERTAVNQRQLVSMSVNCCQQQ